MCHIWFWPLEIEKNCAPRADGGGLMMNFFCGKSYHKTIYCCLWMFLPRHRYPFIKTFIGQSFIELVDGGPPLKWLGDRCGVVEQPTESSRNFNTTSVGVITVCKSEINNSDVPWTVCRKIFCTNQSTIICTLWHGSSPKVCTCPLIFQMLFANTPWRSFEVCRSDNVFACNVFFHICPGQYNRRKYAPNRLCQKFVRKFHFVKTNIPIATSRFPGSRHLTSDNNSTGCVTNVLNVSQLLENLHKGWILGWQLKC